jgi:DNA adenine methylase
MKTLLRRQGSKSRISNQIQAYFPYHKQYIELFFGAGGMFFNKPKARYNTVNDSDDEVFNLFQVVMKWKPELIELMKIIPQHSTLLEHWSKNAETEAILRAGRFLSLSNYTFLSSGSTLSVGCGNATEIILRAIDETYDYMFGVQFLNCDFRDMLSKIHFKHGKHDREQAFIYADPPYLATSGKCYESGGFTETDTMDLFEVLCNSGIKFAMSEFDNPVVVEKAKSLGLHIAEITSRHNLGDRQTEILIMNYELQKKLF